MAKKGFGGLADLRGKVPDASAPKASHADLEAAIAASPNDRELYRVYADALERAGDPRGPFIALHDEGLADEAAAYLDEHRDYLLGSLATAVQSNAVELTWSMGFVSAIRIARAPREQILVTLDTIANLPSCRFLRGLTVEPRLHDDAPKIVEHLATLARPTTLAALFIAFEWTSNGALLAAFPHLRAAVADIDERFRTAPSIERGVAWDDLPMMTTWGIARRTRSLPRSSHLSIGWFGGARVCTGGNVANLAMPPPTTLGSLVIDGDLVVDGMFEHAGAGPVIVLGSLTCESICTDSYLIVTGDLSVRDVLYGSTSDHGLVVLGTMRAAAVVLDNGYVVDTGRSDIVELVEVEEGWDENVVAWLDRRGLSPARGVRAIAAALRR